MMQVLEHRGPDDRGVYISPGRDARSAALGHQRLAIIDVATGHQPMCNEDETLWIVFNGEIYNHRELRRELKARGHTYKTNSDTETVIHAYEEYGETCVEKFRGMFAFAIWDERTKQLFAARDRLGIKPFYYARSNGTFLFASEIKSILSSGLVEPAVNHRVLPEFFTMAQTLSDSTLFVDIKKLAPGHWLHYDGSEVTIRRYWDWNLETDRPARSEDYYVDRFAELFEDSVRAHLMSDVPLGVFLSGGLDSSFIAALMAKHMSAPVKTFSVGFEEKYYSEFDYSRVVARHIGAEHHEVTLTPRILFDTLPKLIWHEDEPLKGAASVALYFVSQLAKRHVKVVLTGEGSDELFAGYNHRYWGTLVARRLARWGGQLIPEVVRRQIIRKTLWQWPLPLPLKKKISHTPLYLSDTVEGLFFDNFHTIFTREMQCELLDATFHRGMADCDPYDNALAILHSSKSDSFLHKMLYTDLKVDLVELLMKQDQMSMAASLESRLTFLDHVLVEYAGTLPPQLRLKGRSGKWLVKKAAQAFLPNEIIHRPKMGFPVPFESWIKEDQSGFIRDVLLGSSAKSRGYFNTSYIEKLLHWHRAGLRDCHSQIWMLLNFELWQQTFFDGSASRFNRSPEFPSCSASSHSAVNGRLYGTIDNSQPE
jgi:asparagine synthase (glutamine-hydrolysing)